MFPFKFSFLWKLTPSLFENTSTQDYYFIDQRVGTYHQGLLIFWEAHTPRKKLIGFEKNHFPPKVHIYIYKF